MGKTTQLFVGFLVAFGLATGAAARFVPGAGGLLERLGRIAWVGAPLLEVRLPAPGQQMPVGAVEVLVRAASRWSTSFRR